ncbi:ATP-binding cassette domain-containing protein [Nocardioides sp. BP30]|uniref:ATP-binding cassette domain-containing protein n=1 Tax=Nocardioides sp. BP30 TaxID=3036374 RepID=UPI00246996D5|nr:ATP-binding cassette domain-containing protein [Nocardioides sp. BP30]WGL53509.1 ATP-binding cassette domain-containing protein [Nocardioides sp. BP30]
MTQHPDAHHPTYDPAASVVRACGLCRSLTPDGGILDGLDLDLHGGQVVAVVGRRGSGKTTLLRALARLDREVVASGYLRTPERIAVLGDPGLRPWKRVLDEVALGVTASAGGASVADVRPRARRALAEVGLIDLEDTWAGELCPADQHRVALARALAGDPELLLADEPYRALDALDQRLLHRALRLATARRGLATVVVTHDPHEALVLADRVVGLAEGRVHLDLAVRGPDGEAPVEDGYAEAHEQLLALIGTGAHRAAAPQQTGDVRRETA